MSSTFAVMAGGGTAGHVHPALAIADALVARGHERAAIHFIGAERGMERELVPGRGYPFTGLDVRGFGGGFTPAGVAAKVRAAGLLAAASARALALLGRLRPHVLVSVGGYASVPAVLAAAVRRVPIVTVSYDAVPGKATKLAARLAAASAVAFPGSSLPRSVVTGTPLRAEIASADRRRDRHAARARLGLPYDRFVLLVVGGSLGSGHLNEVTRRFVAGHRHRDDLAVRHVTGRRDDTSAPEPAGADRIVYQLVRYEDDMASAYVAADVVLARAGATTVAELAALGVPSILVPWPLAAGDHQAANARALGGTGGAIVVRDADLDETWLARTLDRLAEPGALEKMGAAAAAAGHRDGAERVAALVERHAR